MKLLIVLFVAFLAAQTTCLAQDFKVGDRVTHVYTKQTGTVTEVSRGGAGGFALTVKLDSGGELMFDSNNLRHGAAGDSTGQNQVPGGNSNTNLNQTQGGQSGPIQNQTPGGAPSIGPGAGQFQRGQRVYIPSIQAYATVLDTTNTRGVGGNAVNVRLDNRGGITMFDPSNLVHTNIGTPNLDTRIEPWHGPTNGAAGGNPPAQNQAKPGHVYTGPTQIAGAGMPPSGNYKGVYTIGTTLMGAEGLTINGNHYSSGSHSGTISMGAGGSLSFSNGLGGLEGCKFDRAIFVPAGPLANHPTIEAFFITPGGNGAQIDYSLE